MHVVDLWQSFVSEFTLCQNLCCICINVLKTNIRCMHSTENLSSAEKCPNSTITIKTTVCGQMYHPTLHITPLLSQPLCVLTTSCYMLYQNVRHCMFIIIFLNQNIHTQKNKYIFLNIWIKRPRLARFKANSNLSFFLIISFCDDQHTQSDFLIQFQELESTHNHTYHVHSSIFDVPC